MINQNKIIVNKNEGVKIPNARVGLGGTRAFTLKNQRLAREAGKRRAGKKEGVLGEGIFARPAQFSANSCPPPQAAG